jgi:hypothetical protein
MQHPCGIANAAGIQGHIDHLLLHLRRLPSVGILQEKRPPALWARPTPIPLLPLPCRAMAHNIDTVTVGQCRTWVTMILLARVGVSLSYPPLVRIADQHL